MHSCLDGGLHGANVLATIRRRAVPGQQRCARRSIVRNGILSDALDASTAKSLHEAFSNGYIAGAKAQASALQAELSRQASEAADAVSSSSSSLPDAVAEPLTALQDGVQGQAPLLQRLQQVQDGTGSSAAPQAHFGRDAVESAFQTAAPQLSSGQPAELLQRLQTQLGELASQIPSLSGQPAELLQRLQAQLGELASQLPKLPSQLSSGQPAELLQRLQTQLSELASQIPSLPSAVDTGALQSAFESPLSVLQGAQRTVVDLLSALGNGVGQGTEALLEGIHAQQVLRGAPGSDYAPHFGTTAALQALEPLRAALAGRGLSFDGVSGYSLDAGSLQRAAVAALEEGVQAIEGLIHALAAAINSTPAGQQAEGAVAGAAANLAASLMYFEEHGAGGYSAGVITAVAVALAVAIAVSTPGEDHDPSNGWIAVQDVPSEYDRQVVQQYFVSRPVAVARRSLRVAWSALTWGSGLGVDYVRGRLLTNSALRSRQLRQHIERLGPAFVKVAQALSTRVDLLDANYLVQIEMLQDRVPPFPTEVALEVMQQAWGRPVNAVLSKISDEPVAAASLGQVYRGIIKGVGGGEVAIKVQRPDVLSSVALDLYLMRGFAVFLQRLQAVTTDWASLIDAWALRFYSELAYEKEAATADVFRAQMAKLPGIVVPAVYPGLTTRMVLVTEWVEGEKLSESNASDVRELCNTLLNCYLTQLLETGLLHADPHPGNLLRTPDGKVCILDFGLMTEVTQEQSMALVEYIAHLSLKDWAAVPEDLRRLGFISADAPDSSVIAEPLGRILGQISIGGGAKGVNLDQITRDIEALTESYPFEIPSYFALILRCFSVLEGIALRVDPSYSIVGECFPYLARRLLQDNDPRIQTALRATLYGNKTRIDVARLQRLASGFNRFTVDGLNGSTGAGSPQPVAGAAAPSRPLLDKNAREALRLVFAPRGSYAAELFAEEAAAAADALGRSGAYAVCQLVLDSVPAALALSLRAGLPRPVQAVAPLGPVSFFVFLDRLQPVVAPTPEDEDALDVVRGVAEVLRSASLPAPDAATSGRALQLARELAPLLPELAPGLLFTAELFVRRLASRIAARIAQAGLSRPGQDEEYVPASNFMVAPADGSTAETRLQGAPAWLQVLLLNALSK